MMNKPNDLNDHNISNQQSILSDTQTLPPAVTLPLTGRYLIEASAGTGKTWTLTGVVLRLIVEAGQPCEKIIATTFTRSAAAEMRQRIRERLQDFYSLLRVITDNSFDKINRVSHDASRYEMFIQALQGEFEPLNLMDKFKDPINRHLIEWIAQQIFSKESTDASSKIKSSSRPIDFRIALQRTTLALNQLDRLFVSTLDSLCQKWLREFSSETGFSADIKISNDVDNIILGIIHDQLRAFLAQVNLHEPKLYALMQKKGVFHSAVYYQKAVEQALNFYTANIDDEVPLNIDIDAIEQLINKIVSTKNPEFEAYLDLAYRDKQGLQYELKKYFEGWLGLQAQLTDRQVEGLIDLQGIGLSFLNALTKALESGRGLNAKKADEIAAFKANEMIQDLHRLSQAKRQLEQHFENINYYFIQFISRYVRDNLPQILESQGLTTFSLQLARLNKALEGKQGESLARYIRHQYPIALIDESQDINTEQALLIQRIYLTDENKNKEAVANQEKVKSKYFLLLVGDPKQAIYRFRGGDVHNYTSLKQFFPTKARFSLTQNRRSSEALIHSLNHWYGVGDIDIDESLVANLPSIHQQPYYMGEGIYYRKISAAREATELANADGATLPALCQIVIEHNTPYPDDKKALATDRDTEAKDESDNIDYIKEGDAIAAQILQLLDDDQAITYKQDKLSLDDICVLAIKNKDLDKIEKILQQRGIFTVRGGNQSVFADSMSQDMLLLMAALLSPFNQAKVNAVLLSSFFQLTLADVTRLRNDAENLNDAAASDSRNKEGETSDFNDIQTIFVQAGEYWQKQSFLVAIQWLMNQDLMLPNQPKLNFWQRLARHQQGERLLIDFRQLLDILSEQISEQGGGEYQLFDWFYTQVQSPPKDEGFLQQRLPSEKGVKLMTAHSSKGLEFPIVFVVGLTASLTTSSKFSELFLYSEVNTSSSIGNLLNRRLSAIPSNLKTGIDYQEIRNDALYEEKLRLMYVALTRAREQVYIVTMGTGRASNSSPLKPFVTDNKTFTLKPELEKIVNKIDINSLSKYISTNQKLTTTKKENTTLPIEYEKYISTIQLKKFTGWANTSFTALSRYMSHDRLDSVINDEGNQDDEIHMSDLAGQELAYEPVGTQPLLTEEFLANPLLAESSLLRFNFEKGTNAGSFLHTVLEDLANNYIEDNHQTVLENHGQSEAVSEWLPPKRWSIMIDRALRRYQMPSQYYSTLGSSEGNFGKEFFDTEPLQPEYLQLTQWLNDVIHTPLKSSSQRLIDIKYHQKIAEMGFNMRLNEVLSFKSLNALFEEYNINLQLQEQLSHGNLWQYLKGEIDLVYQHQDKFYVVDYKSNYLGNQFKDYDIDNLAQSMSEHSYWLQASIYQVALHRFLSLRVPNYDINQHLGAVEYAFIRGMTPNQAETGRLVWQPPVEFIMALDKLFGNPNH